MGKLTDRVKFVKMVFNPNLDIATLEQSTQTEKIILQFEAKTNKPGCIFSNRRLYFIKRKKISAGTVCVFKQMKEQLKAFKKFDNKPINLESFNYDFYERFVDFLSFDYEQRRRKKIIKGLKINTIGKTVLLIKEIAKQANIIQPITFSYKKGNKDIVETKPKYALVTSHIGRRSFCTNEFLAGIPPKLIMQISGHKKEKLCNSLSFI